MRLSSLAVAILLLIHRVVFTQPSSGTAVSRDAVAQACSELMTKSLDQIARHGGLQRQDEQCWKHLWFAVMPGINWGHLLGRCGLTLSAFGRNRSGMRSTA